MGRSFRKEICSFCESNPGVMQIKSRYDFLYDVVVFDFKMAIKFIVPFMKDKIKNNNYDDKNMSDVYLRMVDEIEMFIDVEHPSKEDVGHICTLMFKLHLPRVGLDRDISFVLSCFLLSENIKKLMSA